METRLLPSHRKQSAADSKAGPALQLQRLTMALAS
jgi:hypothetical protein